MKKLFLLAALVLASVVALAAEDGPPRYPGGQSAMNEYLIANTKYPADAKAEGVEGRVVCSFVVDEDGNVVEVKVVRSAHPSLDAEALRVISSMPKWQPGTKDGKPVRVRLSMPLTFKL